MAAGGAENAEPRAFAPGAAGLSPKCHKVCLVPEKRQNLEFGARG